MKHTEGRVSKLKTKGEGVGGIESLGYRLREVK